MRMLMKVIAKYPGAIAISVTTGVGTNSLV